MLGRRSTQTGLFSAESLLGAEQICRIAFYGDLAASWRSIFRDEDFEDLYADKGRRSVPPSILATATLLQSLENISDAEVVERTKYDLRWKAVFDTSPCSLQPLFAKSSFQLFRLRLVLNEKQGLVFDAVLAEARRRGLLPKKLQLALDTSPVRGRGAVKDAFNLLSDAIGRVLRSVARKEETDPLELARALGLERHLQRGSVKGSQVVDWESDASVRAFLAELVEDCQRVVEAAKEAETATEEVELLTKVVAENVEETPEGPQIPQKVPKGRTSSVHDEEMRHGHKSTGKLYTGHKAHVAVDTNSQFITAIEMSEPSSPEGKHVGSLIEQSEARTQSSVNESLGDCAYSSRTAQAQAAEARVPLVTKMPSPPKGRFGPGDFEVSEDGKAAKCPAGHPSAKVGRSNGDVVHRWSPEDCGACPFKARCLRGEAKKRSLRVTSDFHERREREAYAHSSEGREKLRLRTLIEHAIGYMKNLGAGTARYVGRAKTLFQWFGCGAVVNLRRLWKAMPAPALSLLLVAVLPLALLALVAAPAHAMSISLESRLASDVHEKVETGRRSLRGAPLALAVVQHSAPSAIAHRPPRSSRPPAIAAAFLVSPRRLVLRRRSSTRGPPRLLPPRRRPHGPRWACLFATPDPRRSRCCSSVHAQQTRSWVPVPTGLLRTIDHPTLAQAFRSTRLPSGKRRIRARIAGPRPVRRVERSCVGRRIHGAGAPREPPGTREGTSPSRSDPGVDMWKVPFAYSRPGS